MTNHVVARQLTNTRICRCLTIWLVRNVSRKREREREKEGERRREKERGENNKKRERERERAIGSQT